jgi:two-component system, sensor histidine kinase and response regulator
MISPQEIPAYKILIVDDVPKNIQLVANFLTKAGYQINFAVDGQHAIEHSLKEKFDLILLDIMMPGMDGFEVCSKLKANPETAEIPIIFLTAKTDDASIAKGFDAGGVDYITKPFNPTELLARVKTHLRLRQRELELTNLNQTKDVFLSIIGHDLKTPVANIVSIGEIIINNIGDASQEEKNELLTDIVESGRQGLWLLENLLAWTRIQTGKITFDPQELILDEVVDKNVSFITPVALRKSINISSDSEKELTVYTDLNILNTILRNLLSNAVKFTSPGGSVSVIAQKMDEESVYIAVKDSGVGIDADRIKSLFNTIGSASTLGTFNEKGSGLGLALVNDLADVIHAILEVESLPGEGSTFKLIFKITK